jgi:alpha,alpha-trehalose phosphorylase
LALAFDYLSEAALIDLRDLMHNTRDGLHIAALAGTWIALVVGFGGMRDTTLPLRFAPRLPAALRRLVFCVCFRDRRLRVEITRNRANYSLTAGSELEILHHGKPATIQPDRRLTLPIPRAPRRKPATQPHGRAPDRRRPGVKS